MDDVSYGDGLMPTVMIVGPYRFFFYSADSNEPRHVHVERDNQVAKFWIDPIVLHRAGGFSRKEIRRVHRLVVVHQRRFSDAWDEHFGQ